MELENKQCYPIVYESIIDPNHQNLTSHNWSGGLTFKERLIIALASNPAIFSNEDGTPNTYGEKGIKANCHYIINQADAIINQLTKE